MQRKIWSAFVKWGSTGSQRGKFPKIDRRLKTEGRNGERLTCTDESGDEVQGKTAAGRRPWKEKENRKRLV